MRSFVLWLLAAPMAWTATPPSITTIVDSAGYGTPIAQGLVATIFGDNLSTGTEAAAQSPPPAILAGTQVFVDGVAAQLYYVSPTQINFIVPPNGGQNLTVVSGQVSSPATPVKIGLWAPGFFTMDSTPTGPVAAEHADGSLITTAHPARPGETIQIFGTCLGTISNQLPIAFPGATVIVGGISAQITYNGPAPTIPGVTQINVTIPLNAPTGPAVPIQMTFESTASNIATLLVGASTN
jgi:uncharacterized protein (TIGR03437 family)